MATDMRPLKVGELCWEFEVGTDLPDTEVAIGYPDLSVVPHDYRLILTDLDAGKSIYMRTTHGYSYVSEPQGGVCHFRVSAAPKSKTNLLVTAMTAQQLSSQRATVTHTLSAPALVDINIRNMAGRPIRQVQTGGLQLSGTHNATWHLTNAAGTPVLSHNQPAIRTDTGQLGRRS